jgi:simple sugar transport system ATP-binding protein
MKQGGKRGAAARPAAASRARGQVKAVRAVSSARRKAAAPLLEVEGIVKKFGEFRANDGVALRIGEGEIHALLGENGAGKSTLVKMLYGSLQPDEGTIRWQGSEVRIASPAEARRIGIGMVFQHFSLFESLTVADNIRVSLDAGFAGGDIAEKARELSHAYGLPLHPHSLVGDLSVGERQRAEIVRCLLQQPRLVILDEPTSVLTPQEADKLFLTLERLRGEGVSILYISHRLEEVKRLCDRATVLRHGKVVAQCDPRRESAASLAAMMVGANVAPVRRQPAAAAGEPLMTVEDVDLPAATPFAVALKDISLALKPGEVLGVAGVAGNGQGELYRIVSGEETIADNNAIRLRGRPCGSLGVNARRALGAAFVPEERLGHGAVPALSLAENLLLSRHGSDKAAFLGPLGLVRNDIVLDATRRVAAAMDVRKTGDNPEASSLSGGNLQKFIMGRELDRSPSVLVVNQPTWGVDAGASARIRQALIDLARSGSAVMVISQDLDEIFEICDAIVVMHHGRLSVRVPIGEATYARIGLLMGGASLGEVEAATRKPPAARPAVKVARAARSRRDAH